MEKAGIQGRARHEEINRQWAAAKKISEVISPQRRKVRGEFAKIEEREVRQFKEVI
jgi:hypothetical protein